MTYQFKLDIYEVPLDLLLHPIKEQKMDIHDIPIAEITRQYLEFVDMMNNMNLELAGEYLVMAAELTRIKSRVLLPSDSFAGEKEAGDDPRAELLARLLEYQRYKNASDALRKLEIERQQVFPSGGTPVLDDVAEGEVLVSATVFDLFTAFIEDGVTILIVQQDGLGGCRVSKLMTQCLNQVRFVYETPCS